MELEFSHGSVLVNEEQYKVITSPISENQRILASAGSGKTTTITARIAYLIEEYHMDPRTIVLVTFSRAAAQEMIHRVHRLTGPIPLYAGTFHSLCIQLLREHAPDQIQDHPFVDEFPYRAAKWLQTDKGKKWAKQLRCIIVDEFQDINEVQWNLLMGLRQSPWATMTIVGDDAQNIYTWRGSSVSYILHFHTKLHHVKDYQLCRNYRSAESIVTIANAVMRFIPTLPWKEKMVAHTKGGRKPEVHYFFRSSDECDWIANSVEKLHRQYPLLTFAVLSRYNSDLFKMEERFHQKHLSYHMFAQYDPERTVTHTKRISLATIHGSKGLEWDIVFFMNLNDEVFPSRKSDEEIVCERRLFYVGVTRAKKALYLTYSRQERSLSRFVREIPRPFLRFHNVSSFQLTTTESPAPSLSVEDMVRGLDGADWNALREQKAIPSFPWMMSEAIYPFGVFFPMPEWVKTLDVRETWYELLKWTALRTSAIHWNTLATLETPEIRETLLTIRIYREDMEFWEAYEAELEHFVYKFLPYTPEMPSIEYDVLDSYVKTKMKHLEWTPQETCKALILLAKIRGQLRPMRHRGFRLDEFSFGCVRHSVPTDLRPAVVESWHRVQDPTKKASEIQGDLWRIASLSSVAKGRTLPLYQYDQVLPYIEEKEHTEQIAMLESALPVWMASQEKVQFHYSFEMEDVKPMSFDVLTEEGSYQIAFDPAGHLSEEDKILLVLKQYAYEEKYDRFLPYMGAIQLATGLITRYEITSTIREQISRVWQYLQTKYHLFEE